MLQPTVYIKYPHNEIIVQSCARTFSKAFEIVSDLVASGVAAKDIQTSVPASTLALSNIWDVAYFSGSFNPHWALFLIEPLAHWNKALEEAAWEHNYNARYSATSGLAHLNG